MLRRVNVSGTKNIIEQYQGNPVIRLVYISSVHAIPENDGECHIEDIDCFSGELVKGTYATTKDEATQAVLDAARDGLDAIIVHPSGIIGPYDSGNNHTVQLIKMYLSGTLPAGVVGGYDFVDVRDVAKGIIVAAEKGTVEAATYYPGDM